MSEFMQLPKTQESAPFQWQWSVKSKTHYNPNRQVLVDFWRKASEAKEIGFDLETNGLNPRKNDILLYIFSVEHVEGIDILVINGRDSVEYSAFLEAVLRSDFLFIGHNLVFDYKFIYSKHNIEIKRMYDTMLAESVAYMGMNLSLKLTALTRRYFDVDLDKKVRGSFIDLHPSTRFTEEQIQYAAEDTRYLFGIKREQELRLNEYDLMPVAVLEFETIPVTAEMELTGFKLDLNKIRRVIKTSEESCLRYLRQIHSTLLERKLISSDAVGIERAQKAFSFASDVEQDTANRTRIRNYIKATNINSPADKLKYLHALGVYPTDDKGSPTTGARYLWKELKKLDGEARTFVLNLLNLAKEFKFLSSYLWKFLEIHEDGYYYPAFWQIKARGVQQYGHDGGTASGRYSSPFQTAPSDNRFRTAFGVDDGFSVITSDFGAMEVRIGGNASNEEVLVEFFSGDETDFHAWTAARVFSPQLQPIFDSFKAGNIEKDYPQYAEKINAWADEYGMETLTDLVRKVEVVKDGKLIEAKAPLSIYRDRAKTTTFALFYGSTAIGLAPRVGVDVEQMQEILDSYREQFPNLFGYLDSQAQKATERFYADDGSLGRKRFFEKTTWKGALSKYGRVAMNMVPQGTNASITKRAMRKIFDYSRESLNGELKILGTVHDEVIVRCPEDKAEEYGKIVQRLMIEAAEEILPGPIPYEAGCIIDKSWRK